MATPYFQLRLDRAPSTQDVARERIEDLPLLVIASAQTEGRGRSGAKWLNADRALAASLAYRHQPDDERPISLMAGVAALRAFEGASLKWPNDILSGERKVGGILVERGGDLTVVGAGVNLWWETPPRGAGSLFDSDPGEERHVELGALWGAELMNLIDEPGWPRDEYAAACTTVGMEITWEPSGEGIAIGIAADGGLVVDSGEGETTIHAGAVSHVRPA